MKIARVQDVTFRIMNSALFFISSFLLLFVTAQNTTTNGSSSGSPCLRINNSTVASDFNDYPLPDVFQSTRAFDDFILNQAQDRAEAIETFRNRYECPKWDGSGQRYYLSYLSSLWLHNSSLALQTLPGSLSITRTNTSNTTNACVPLHQNLVHLCHDTCLIARQAISSIFDNPSFCNVLPPSTPGSQQRLSLLGSFDILCRVSLNSSNSHATCVPGIQLELKQCGFAVQRHAEEYCRSSAVDPCCEPWRRPSSPGNQRVAPPPAVSSISTPKTNADESSSTAKIFTKDVIIAVIFSALILVAISTLVPTRWWIAAKDKTLALFGRRTRMTRSLPCPRWSQSTFRSEDDDRVPSFIHNKGNYGVDIRGSVVSITEEFSKEYGSYFKE